MFRYDKLYILSLMKYRIEDRVEFCTKNIMFEVGCFII